jgi:outer membrane murein-binding lipoprotein Lpp
LKSDVGTLKSDVSTLKSDVGTLKSDVGTLKSDVGTLKSDVSTLKSEMVSLNDRVSNLEDDMRYIKVDLLENNVIPRLSTIESCYTSTYDRYKNGAEKFDAAFSDIVVMKVAIAKNAQDIQELQLKQA